MFLIFAIKRRLTKHFLKIMDIHVYSAGVGKDKPLGSSFRINILKPAVTLVICCIFPN